VSYKVLALKYRPTSFDEVVGQTTVTRTLRNALERGKVGHAFLLSGARGVGKTTTARILAKALNCSKSEGPTANPCSTRTDEDRARACPSCREIADGKSLDVQEIDGASNTGVDAIRELREMTRYLPARDRFKIWIIDEVHQISASAFNALLKTLEEPPPRVKFIFATTEYHKIPETILSRCQQYDFRMIPARELLRHLRHVADQEQIRVSDAALALIARAAEGSVRDSLSLFDQVLAFTGDEVQDGEVAGLLGLVDRQLVYRATRAMVQGASLEMLELVESLADHGADYRHFLRELLLHLRDVLLVKLAAPDSRLLSQVLPEELEELRGLAGALSEEDLLRALDLLTQAETDMRNVTDARVSVDLVLLKLVQLRRLQPFAELVARVEQLAAGEGVAARPAAPRPPAPRPPAPTTEPAPRAPAETRRAAPAPEPARPLPPRPTRPAESTETLPPTGPLTAPPAPARPPLAAARDEEGEGDAAPPTTPPAAGGDELAALVGLCQGRPSLAAPLRSAQLKTEGEVLVLEVLPDFLAFARAHAEDYRSLARQLRGRAVALRVEAGRPPASPADEPKVDPQDDKRRKLREEAEREPAVQEALDLFDGRVVDVREAMPGREDS
jgi:DNA polymerase-3 subunit gamma/tau